MKRLLSLTAIVGLASGCYIGETDDAIHIISLRAIQTDPTKDTCDDQLVAFDALVDTTTNLKAISTARRFYDLTYFIASNVLTPPATGFNNDNLLGAHHNDFLADTIVLEYSSDSVSLPTERIPTFIRVVEGQSGTDSCAQADILGSQALATLGNLTLTDPIIVKIKTHLEGTYVNGKISKTASVVMPLTLKP